MKFPVRRIIRALRWPYAIAIAVNVIGWIR